MTARALPSLDEPKRAFKGVWIPAEIWLNKKLSWLQKCLLAEIDSLDDGMGCRASNDHFSDMLGITKGSVKSRISELKQMGFITDLDPIKNGPQRLLRIVTGHHIVTSGHGTVTVRLPNSDQNCIPNSEIYSVIGGDLLGLPCPEIPIESTKEIIPPMVPQGGRSKKVAEVPVEIRDIAARFWEANPSTRPPGEKEASKHLRDLQALVAFGISEAQLFRARSLLSADNFRSDWVSDLSSMLKNWTRIAGRLNGELKDPGTHTSVFNLKTVIKAKEDKAIQIKQKNSAEVAMGTFWSSESAKADYIRLRKEIRTLNDQLAESL